MKTLEQIKFDNWIAWVKSGLDRGLITPANIRVTITEIDEEKLADTLVKDLVEPNKAIILMNDDVNSFLHVISCLMMYCEHSKEQAEQVATIVHHNGKCDVKHGSYEKLKPIAEALLDQKLNCKIE